ncbi:4649_t:CDS:2, partial [Acaulospora morrowiae]
GYLCPIIHYDHMILDLRDGGYFQEPFIDTLIMHRQNLNKYLNKATVNKNSVISIKKHINYVKELDKPIINETSIESVEHLDYITEPDPSIVIKSSIESIGYMPKLDKHNVEYIGYAPASNKPIVIKSSIESIDSVPELNEPELNESKSNKLESNEPESNELIISNETISNTIESEARKAKTQVNRKRRLECHELGRMDQENTTTEISILIHSDRTQDPGRYGPPTASEVAIIMIDDGHEMKPSSRDILLRLCSGGLQKILEFCSSYDSLHYVLLFPRGDDGWHFDIPLIGAKKRDK